MTRFLPRFFAADFILHWLAFDGQFETPLWLQHRSQAALLCQHLRGDDGLGVHFLLAVAAISQPGGAAAVFIFF